MVLVNNVLSIPFLAFSPEMINTEMEKTIKEKKSQLSEAVNSLDEKQRKQMQHLRSGGAGALSMLGGLNDEKSGPILLSPNDILKMAEENNIAPAPLDIVFMNDCLSPNGGSKTSKRSNGYNLFKRQVAGPWFKLFGYLCSSESSIVNAKCWKKSVEYLTHKLGREEGGSLVARCVKKMIEAHYGNSS